MWQIYCNELNSSQISVDFKDIYTTLIEVNLPNMKKEKNSRQSQATSVEYFQAGAKRGFLENVFRQPVVTTSLSMVKQRWSHSNILISFWQKKHVDVKKLHFTTKAGLCHVWNGRSRKLMWSTQLQCVTEHNKIIPLRSMLSNKRTHLLLTVHC